MNNAVKFLEEAGTYYLATCDGNLPRVRPFGTVLWYKDRLYIQTGKVKAVSRQLHENPAAEICAFKDGKWIRISGSLLCDDDREARKAMLDKYPHLRTMYNEDDGNTEVWYFQGAVAVISSFTEAPETIIL